MYPICILSFCVLQLSSSFVSVVFDFNAPLNGFAPVSPILFPVDLMRMIKVWIIDRRLYMLFLYSPFRSSSRSVMFDFNTSINDVAPLSPMSFPMNLIRMEELIVDRCHLCVVYCVFTSQI